jgi:ribonuclease Z
MRIQIEPHADLRAAPRSLFRGERRIDIIEIMDQWYGPDYRYVKVRGHDNHGIPCLAFAFEEKLRVNVWREGLRRLGLPVGPWLREAKRAVRQGAPDHSQVCVHDGLAISLGDLKQHALRTARGQKIAYVVDLAYDQQNIGNVIALARNADQLFIEAPFLDVDANIAAERRHLTAHQAGHIAKQARVGRLIPFHFSARYRDRAEELTREAEEAFSVSGSPKLPD